MARRSNRKSNRRSAAVQKKAHRLIGEPLGCGCDANGVPLKPGEALICLCCGALGYARPKKYEEDGFDFDGSSWVQLRSWGRKVIKTVKEQAGDEGLWFEAKAAPEAYLQQGLRRLHSVIEGNLDEPI